MAVTLEQLQQELAALKQQVDGITAPPTDYYTSRWSGEEIDNGVARALPGGAIDTDISASNAAIQQHPNPNLLDNWYFVGGGGPGQFPVNQRGQTEYTGNGYCIDRWRKTSNDGAISLAQDGLQLVSAGGKSDIILDNLSDIKLIGPQDFTLSILVTAFDATAGRLEVQAMNSITLYIQGPGLYTKSFKASFSGNIDIVARMYLQDVPAGETATIAAVKLELGSKQTLAHQEGGKWVLNEIPDYGEQLARCQRYQVVLPAISIIGVANNQTTIYANIPTPVPMRAVPAIENNGVFSVRGEGMAQSNLTASAYSTSLNANGIRVGIGGTFTPNVPYSVAITDKIVLNANL